LPQIFFTMTTEERINQQRQLVENLGRLNEHEGMQPVAGRIFSLLMIMDKEHFTFDEIVEELNISKSSASVAIKMLQIRGLIEYFTLPGDRKRYFRIKRHEPFNLFEEFKNKMIEKHKYMQQILDLKADPDSKNSKYLRELCFMLEFFKESVEKLRLQYEESKK